MKKVKLSNALGILFSIAIVVVIGWLIWAVIGGIYGAILNLKGEVAVAIIAGSTTIMAAVLALVLGRHYEAKKEREVAHREKKVVLYDEFTARLFHLFTGEKSAPESDPDLVPFLRETQRKLILWAGPKVVVSFARWHRVLTSQGDAPKAEAMMTMIDFFLALREDLGHSNQGINREHIVRFLLQQPDLIMEMYRKNPNVSFAEIMLAEKLLAKDGSHDSHTGSAIRP